jgi:hypothetical protein
VQEWADGEYIGGNEVHLFEHAGKKAVVVLGMPTSGRATTQITVLEPWPTGKLAVILTRRTVEGIVGVFEDERGLVFADEVGEPVLVVPWNGVKVERPDSRAERPDRRRSPESEPLPPRWSRTCAVKDGVVALTTDGAAVWRVNGATRVEVKLPVAGTQLTEGTCIEVKDTILILYEVEDAEGAGLRAALVTPSGLAWAVDAKGYGRSEPLVTDRAVFLATDPTVMKVDLATGRVLWSRRDPGKKTLPDSTYGSLRLAGSTLTMAVRAHQDGERVREVVLDAKSGKTLSAR